MRVVSLLPSATEVCYALGVEPVGVSHECDYPPAAREQPSVDRSRVDPDATSADINEQVADAESEAGSVYEIDRETLSALDPDVVVTQGVCDVCAVDTVLVEDALGDVGSDAEVLTTDTHSLADLYHDIERLGTAFDRAARADAVVADLRDRVDAVARRTGGLDRPRVAVLDWMDPVMVAGHWTPELVELAGGAYGMAETGERSRPREWRAVREYDPEVLVAAPCGFELDRTLANAAELTDRPGWADLSAVDEGRAVAMDGHHYVNRPGPRLVDTLEHLASVLHPDVFGDPPREVVRPLAAPASDDHPERRA
ncbi:cobalamin-binding protein [Halobacteriales archaeon SW_7_68_16]|nr:MAG: cobalamin-binding protein [Halobacteriales archaeon SW_7_68_16]